MIERKPQDQKEILASRGGRISKRERRRETNTRKEQAGDRKEKYD